MILSEALAFTSAYPDISSIKMPFKLAMKMYKINLEATKATEFYTTKLNELIDLYGDKDEDGMLNTTPEGGIAIKESMIEKCQEELDALHKLDWLVEGLNFSEEEKEMFEGFELTPRQMQAIYPFF